MTRKDYVLLARAVNTARDQVQYTGTGEEFTRGANVALIELVNALAYSLKQDNPNFDSDRFRIASGVLDNYAY